MDEDDPRGAGVENIPDDVPRVEIGVVHTPFLILENIQDPVPAVQTEDTEDLILPASVPGSEKVGYSLG